MHAAGFGSLLQCLAFHGENLGLDQRNNIRAASLLAFADNGHFAKAVAGGQQVKDSAVLDNLEFALAADAEEISRISVIQYGLARGNAAPMGKPQYLSLIHI